MAIIPVTLGDTARLSLVLEDGDETQFPQVNIYQPTNGSPIATLDLSHTAEGMYETPYAPGSASILNAVYTVYSNAGHTTPNADYSKELDQLITSLPDSSISILSEILEKVCRVLGLVQENVFIDNTFFDECAQLTTSRMRIFDSASGVNNATDGGSETVGLLATYQVTIDYESPGKMKTYRVVRL